jgi:hypothetical protein
MEAVGIRHAFVSSTPTEGTERLYALDPIRVVPLLRPYRTPADRRDWYTDTTLVARLERQLDVIPYRGIGEFHIFGADASTAVMADMLRLAKQHGLFLQAHADEEAILRIAEQAPESVVIWAHAGFDVPVARLEDMLSRFPNLMLELSFRSDIAPDGTLAEAWRDLFIRYPERFMVGMDTYIASRWAELGELSAASRIWLQQLPADVARRIAFANAAELAGGDSD